MKRREPRGSRAYQEATVRAFGYLWSLYQELCVGGDVGKEASGLVLLGTCLSGPEHSVEKGLDVRTSREVRELHPLSSVARGQHKGAGWKEGLQRRFMGDSKEPSRTYAKTFALWKLKHILYGMCCRKRQATGCVVFVACGLDQELKECTSLEVVGVVPGWGDVSEPG